MKVSYINAKDSTTPMVILAVSQEKVLFFFFLSFAVCSNKSFLWGRGERAGTNCTASDKMANCPGLTFMGDPELH